MSSTFVDGRYVNRVYIQETAQELALACDNNTANTVPQRTVVYNPDTRKYTYNYDDKRKIELYSTPDVIAYYFGTNVTDPKTKSKVRNDIYYITFPSMGVDCITYKGRIIGWGASEKDAENAVIPAGFKAAEGVL